MNYDNDILMIGRELTVYRNDTMNPIKITIAPEVAAFNEAVEQADFLTDYTCDTYSAMNLLIKLENIGSYPESSRILQKAIAGLAIKRNEGLAKNIAIMDQIIKENGLIKR